MLTYSVLLEEEDLIYIHMTDGEHIKMDMTKYKEWSKDKLEI